MPIQTEQLTIIPQTIDNRQSGDQGGTITPEDMLGIPPAYRGHYRRAMTGKSRKAAIRAFCLECVGWNASGVRKCTGTKCPLYKFRIAG